MRFLENMPTCNREDDAPARIWKAFFIIQILLDEASLLDLLSALSLIPQPMIRPAIAETPETIDYTGEGSHRTDP